jgi:hypothetical protein
MRNLTTRASNFLKSLIRDTDAVIDRTELENFFINQNIPLFEPVIEFGVRYSGFTLRTKTNKKDAFKALLVSTQDLKTIKQYDFEKEGEQYLFFCGNHETAQFYFYIDQFGQFCSDGYTGANVLSSSFEIEVEQYAFRNELDGWKEHPYYYELCDNTELEKTLGTNFGIVHECSDNYNGWFLSEDIIVQRGIWLHEPSTYLHFWGKKDETLQKFVNHLKTSKIIQTSS